MHENGSSASATIAPNDFRRSISAAWAASDCREQLGALNYRLPPSVGALVDRPSAEAFLDFWWANPNALVLLTRRPALEWVRSRAKFGQAMNLPVDRPNPNPNPNPNGRGRPSLSLTLTPYRR